MSLSREAAVEFLEKKLNIADVEKKLQNDRVLLLTEIQRNHTARIPYQNFQLLAINPDDRVAFTKEQIIEDGLKLLGGTCYVLSNFVTFLLQSLGYDAVVQSSTVGAVRHSPNQHIVTIIRGVQHPDDLYLIDVANWYPSFLALPLHDLKPDGNPIYKNAYMEYTLKREGDLVKRFVRCCTIWLFTADETKDDWFHNYEFSITPRSPTVIGDRITATYKDRSNGSLSAFSFSLYPPNKAVTLKRMKLRVYNEDTRDVTTTAFETAEQVHSALSEYCPELRKEIVVKAYENLMTESNSKK